MIANQLDELIIAADDERCREFFKSLKEAQRKEIAPRALQWANALNGFVHRGRPQFLVFDKGSSVDVAFYESIASGKIVFPNHFKEESFNAARMAVLATHALPDLKKLGEKGLPAPQQAVWILSDRRPSWLDKWCLFILKEFPASHWMALHILEREGLCKVERNSNYWISMMCSLSMETDLLDNVLSTDESVREEIWPMLADPGVIRMLLEPEMVAHEIFRKRWNSGANIFASKQINTRQGTQVWHHSIIGLVDKGLLDRDRMIAFSFEALAGQGEKEAKKSAYVAVSTADFAIQLNRDLVKDRAADYANRYATLLKAIHKDVSTFAATILNGLPDQHLNVEVICSEISPTFLNKSKEPAEIALKLLSRLAKTFPDKREYFGPAILSALAHSSKDIHRKTLSLIDSTKMLEDANLLDEFVQRMDMLAGMERANAAKLAEKYQSDASRTDSKSAKEISAEASSDNVISLKKPNGTKVSSNQGSGASRGTNCDASDGSDNSIELNLEKLQARIAKIDEKLCKAARIHESLEALASGTVCDLPVDLDTFDVPRLDPSKVVKPISNLDDLIYTFMKVWSGKCNGMEIELLLDGVSRFCNERPVDFEQKTDALRQKITTVSQEPSLFSWSGTLGQVAYAWLGGSAEPSAQRAMSMPGTVFARRCLAVAKRVIAKQQAPLLAAPTHAGGWIDPLVLVKRLNEYFWLKVEPDRIDFIQALLRIAPDNRAEALESAGSIKGEIGESLRYALGSESMGRVVTPEFWVAAFRARDPGGTNDELSKLLPNFAPDGPKAAVYGHDMSVVRAFAEDKYASLSQGFPSFLPVESNDPDFPGKKIEKCEYMEMQAKMSAQRQAWNTRRAHYSFYPTVLLHDNGASWFSGTETYTWLHKRESLLLLYAKRMLFNIHSVGTYWLSEFDLLFDPDIDMGKNGRYFFCFAMSSKNNDIARLAVDALIAAIGERRIGAEQFGDVLAEVIPTGIITAVRWTRGLRDAANASSLHAWFVWRAVSRLIQKAEISSTQQIPFLELLTEIQIQHAFVVDEDLKSFLMTISGAGKGAKLSKEIMGFRSNKVGVSINQVAYRDLESRIERAERWQTLAEEAMATARG